MTEKDIRIALEAANLVPRLSEVKKTYLLGFLEGYAAAVSETDDRPQRKMKAKTWNRPNAASNR